MSDAVETAVATERRRQPRMLRDVATFLHRLADAEAPILRAKVTDTSEEGVGLVCMIPVAAGTRVAVDVPGVDAQHELLLCRVQHCSKSPSGQFRIGAQVLQRQPGSAVHTRIPTAWLG